MLKILYTLFWEAKRKTEMGHFVGCLADDRAKPLLKLGEAGRCRQEMGISVEIETQYIPECNPPQLCRQEMGISVEIETERWPVRISLPCSRRQEMGISVEIETLQWFLQS